MTHTCLAMPNIARKGARMCWTFCPFGDLEPRDASSAKEEQQEWQGAGGVGGKGGFRGFSAKGDSFKSAFDFYLALFDCLIVCLSV